VQDFIEKPARESAPTNAINAGTYVLEPAALVRIALGRRVSIEREVFPAMAADRVLFAKCTDDYWLDAGRPDQYLAANLDVIDGVRRAGPEPGVARGVVLDAHAKVHRAAIGAGSVIGAGAHVTESVLLPDVNVGAGAVIVRSLLGRSVDVGAEAELRDTVIGDGVAIEPGTRLDGVRRPEPAT
jgi:mannose-1-phosphate guanylyltransferase